MMVASTVGSTQHWSYCYKKSTETLSISIYCYIYHYWEHRLANINVVYGIVSYKRTSGSKIKNFIYTIVKRIQNMSYIAVVGILFQFCYCFMKELYCGTLCCFQIALFPVLPHFTIVMSTNTRRHSWTKYHETFQIQFEEQWSTQYTPLPPKQCWFLACIKIWGFILAGMSNIVWGGGGIKNSLFISVQECLLENLKIHVPCWKFMFQRFCYYSTAVLVYIMTETNSHHFHVIYDLKTSTIIHFSIISKEMQPVKRKFAHFNDAIFVSILLYHGSTIDSSFRDYGSYM